MRAVNFSEVRNSLKKLTDQVLDDADFTIITRRDAPDAHGLRRLKIGGNH